MKVGIFTYHSAHNYGAVLQAYALQEYLLSQGHDVYIVDYRPKYFNIIYSRFYWRRWVRKNIYKGFLENIFLYSRIKHFRVFEQFIQKYFRLYPFGLLQENTDIETFIFGSDQIWNSIIHEGQLDTIYLGQFPAAHTRRLVSYAASIGRATLPSDEITIFNQTLSSFYAIGVRENSAKELISNFLNKEVVTVLDPTLLADRSIFDRIAVKPKNRKPYILIYQVCYNENLLRMAQHIANEMGVKIIELSNPGKMPKKGLIQTASPEEFVGYFKYATGIVTSSFHATVFSVLYHKSFYTMKLNNFRDARLISLLELLGLSSQLVEQKATPSFSPIDFEEVDKKLHRLQKSSRDFLLNSLK